MAGAAADTKRQTKYLNSSTLLSIIQLALLLQIAEAKAIQASDWPQNSTILIAKAQM
jgi:hypothetical protein